LVLIIISNRIQIVLDYAFRPMAEYQMLCQNVVMLSATQMLLVLPYELHFSPKNFVLLKLDIWISLNSCA